LKKAGENRTEKSRWKKTQAKKGEFVKLAKKVRRRSGVSEKGFVKGGFF